MEKSGNFLRPQNLFDENGVPRYWFNIVPLLAEYVEPLPPPLGTDEQMQLIQKIIVPECLKQEMMPQEESYLWVKIPDELREMYSWPLGRPRKLVRVKELEKYLDTPAELWVMTEFLSTTGSHKINTALAQAYFAKQAGKENLATETGAGQWGTAVASAAASFGLKSTKIFWVGFVAKWKTNRKCAMKDIYGAQVFSSPSRKTRAGRDVLKKNPKHPGDLGIAISEGVEMADLGKNTCYVLGSVLNHVLLHQTIIGLEVLNQLEAADRYPTAMVSCFGGGSNFGGFVLPAVGHMLAAGKKDIRFCAYQSEAFPNLVKGVYKYDDPDHAGLLPKLKMYSLGTNWQGDIIRAGGLGYHGAAPIISLLRHHGYIEAYAFPKDEKKILEAGRLFARKTGWIPAGESAYSIAGAIDLALEAKGTKKRSGKKPVIIMNVSGRADMEAETYK